MEGARDTRRTSLIARKPVATAVVSHSSAVGPTPNQPPAFQPQPALYNPITPQYAFHAQMCPNICNLCKSGIPYETQYYECGFCFVFFCARCISQHHTSHQSSVVRKVSRQIQPTSIQHPRPCGECHKSSHIRYDCRTCQYSICTNCYYFPSKPRHIHADYIVIEVPGKATIGSLSQSGCRTCSTMPGIGHCDRCLIAISSNDILMMCGTCETRFNGSISFCGKCYSETGHIHDPNHQWVSLTTQLCTDEAQKPGVFGCTMCPRRANELKDLLPHHPHNTLVVYLGHSALEIIFPISWRNCQRKSVRTDSPLAVDLSQFWVCDWCSNKFPAQLPYLCRSCPDFGLCSVCFPTAQHLHKHGSAAFAPSQQVEASRANQQVAASRAAPTKTPFLLGKVGIKSVDQQVEKWDKNGKLSRGIQTTGQIGLFGGKLMLAFMKGAIGAEIAMDSSGDSGGGSGDATWDSSGGGDGFVVPPSDPGFVSGLQQDTWTTTSSAATDGIQGGGGS